MPVLPNAISWGLNRVGEPVWRAYSRSILFVTRQNFVNGIVNNDCDSLT